MEVKILCSVGFELDTNRQLSHGGSILKKRHEGYVVNSEVKLIWFPTCFFQEELPLEKGKVGRF